MTPDQARKPRPVSISQTPVLCAAKWALLRDSSSWSDDVAATQCQSSRFPSAAPQINNATSGESAGCGTWGCVKREILAKQVLFFILNAHTDMRCGETTWQPWASTLCTLHFLPSGALTFFGMHFERRQTRCLVFPLRPVAAPPLRTSRRWSVI